MNQSDKWMEEIVVLLAVSVQPHSSRSKHAWGRICWPKAPDEADDITMKVLVDFLVEALGPESWVAVIEALQMDPKLYSKWKEFCWRNGVTQDARTSATRQLIRFTVFTLYNAPLLASKAWAGSGDNVLDLMSHVAYNRSMRSSSGHNPQESPTPATSSQYGSSYAPTPAWHRPHNTSSNSNMYIEQPAYPPVQQQQYLPYAPPPVQMEGNDQTQEFTPVLPSSATGPTDVEFLHERHGHRPKPKSPPVETWHGYRPKAKSPPVGTWQCSTAEGSQQANGADQASTSSLPSSISCAVQEPMVFPKPKAAPPRPDCVPAGGQERRPESQRLPAPKPKAKPPPPLPPNLPPQPEQAPSVSPEPEKAPSHQELQVQNGHQELQVQNGPDDLVAPCDNADLQASIAGNVDLQTCSAGSADLQLSIAGPAQRRLGIREPRERRQGPRPRRSSSPEFDEVAPNTRNEAANPVPNESADRLYESDDVWALIEAGKNLDETGRKAFMAQAQSVYKGPGAPGYSAAQAATKAPEQLPPPQQQNSWPVPAAPPPQQQNSWPVPKPQPPVPKESYWPAPPASTPLGGSVPQAPEPSRDWPSPPDSTPLAGSVPEAPSSCTMIVALPCADFSGGSASASSARRDFACYAECGFLAHPDTDEFGGFCCKRCHLQWWKAQNGCSGRKKGAAHGGRCEGRIWTDEPRAAFAEPRNPMTVGW